MADQFIALDEPAVTDKKIDTTELAVGANTVQRERFVIAGAAAADLAPVSATAGLKVDLGADNDVVATNAGTFAVQAAQSGTWTVQPGNTANITAWKVDGSAVTQPVSVATLPNVTNAGTFAVQDAAAEASLSVMDDWDESDRAKVNIIAGQAGVDGDSGTKSAKTLRVVIATDQPALTTPVPTQPARSATGTVTSPSTFTSSASVTILASNAARLGATVCNEGLGDAFVKLGATASATSYTLKIVTGAYYEVPFGYTGIIDAIGVSGTSVQVRVTELT